MNATINDDDGDNYADEATINDDEGDNYDGECDNCR